MVKKLSVLLMVALMILSLPLRASAGESGVAVPKSCEERGHELEAEIRSLNDQIAKIHKAAQEHVDRLQAENKYLKDELEMIRSAVGGGEFRPS